MFAWGRFSSDCSHQTFVLKGTEMLRQLFCCGLCCLCILVHADEPDQEQSPLASAQAESQAESQAGSPNASRFELTDEVRDALFPLFASIAKAQVSRATVEVAAESRIDGVVVESQQSTYHIASISPDQFTVYLKESEQRTRVFANGESMVVAVAVDAFVKLSEPMTNQQAVTSLPVPLGPYPEPVLALTLAGVDPAISLLGGMKSVKIVDREKFGEEIPAVHLRGVQSDEVTWDLWIATDETPRPLRLAVDLTPMLAASDQVRIPKGYTYQLRFDFLSWRVTGEVDKSLFTYQPPKDATEYGSIEEYYQSIAGVMGDHPLLGKKIPEFEAKTLSGDAINTESFQGKVVVLDFWATWCAPCVASLPTIKQVTDEYADKKVVLYTVNTGEQPAEVEEFLKQRELELNLILDPEGEIASTFVAEAIPQTLVIGKDGVVESTHIGFVGEDALRQRLKDELDVLALGGKIASAQNESASSDGQEAKEDRGEEQP